jgi:hypothetical protein
MAAEGLYHLRSTWRVVALMLSCPAMYRNAKGVTFSANAEPWSGTTGEPTRQVGFTYEGRRRSQYLAGA